ncbi:MAG: hypothetical protein HY217_05420 [Candidatus Rokubacteria bacterium]|nr:hypothetical protein [Candidatus Rokubacteria bacterium]
MPTVADVKPLDEVLAAVTLGAPLTHGALTVVPLLAPGRPEPDWLTLAEAGDAVAVTEVSEAGAVPTLRVTNASDRPVLLLDGEELIGAKQNRVLNTTVLVAAQSTTTIPVSCVEAGRWAYRTRRFAASAHSLFASIRRKKALRVSASLKVGAGHVADQDEVWDELAATAARHLVKSPTGAMHDVYDHYEEEIEEGRRAVGARPGQLGALVYVGGAWAGLELLAAPGLFGRAWPRLCTGYLADAIGVAPGAAVTPTVAEVLAAVATAAIEQAPAAGLGVEYRLEGRITGAALAVDHRLAHLMAFPGVSSR